jgi:DNA-binding response OmpR family regulator
MKKILIAEDEVAIRSLMAHLLTAQGYLVTRAGNGLEAWEEARRGTFDLLITDADMPLLSGEELIERLRAAQPGLPVLLISGDRSRIRRLAERGLCCPFLPKPFRPGELLKQVERLVAHDEPLSCSDGIRVL